MVTIQSIFRKDLLCTDEIAIGSWKLLWYRLNKAVNFVTYAYYGVALSF